MGCVSCAGAVLADNPMTLRLREAGATPVRADSICPDRFAGLGQTAIAALPAKIGSEAVTLGDLFQIEGANPFAIKVSGDLRAVERIGHGMTMGQIVVEGGAGAHTGACMRGGELVILGDAAEWTGASAAGGRIVVEGHAADHLGAAYPSETAGLRGATIVVRGSAGRRAGARMADGTIVVLGDVADEAGLEMTGGAIFVAGRLGPRAGAGMEGGSIVVFGSAADVLPTFRRAAVYTPVFPEHYLRELRRWGLAGEEQSVAGVFRRYLGDQSDVAKGEILIRDQSE